MRLVCSFIKRQIRLKYKFCEEEVAIDNSKAWRIALWEQGIQIATMINHY